MWGSIFLADGFEAVVGLQGPQQLSCKDAQFCRAKTGCHLRQGASPIVLIIIVGGEFKDFSQAATPWLLMGIGIAAVITYSDQKEETHKKD